MIHYTHCHQGYDPLKGGSVGYISSLMHGMNLLKNNITPQGIKTGFIIPNISPDERLRNYEFNSFSGHSSICPEAYFPPEHFDKKYIKNLQRFFHEILPLSEAVKINVNKITSIHIHGVYNFIPVYNTLRLFGLENNVVKILTTHNPEKPELESIELLKRSGLSSSQLLQQKFFLRIKDSFAFNNADAFIFPSTFSIEGYYETWPEFSEIINKKKVYFLLTGTELKNVITPQEIIRNRFNIPYNAKVFLYMGRFMKIRGFDILVEAAKNIISKYPDIYFVIVGEKKLSKSIESANWIEVPFTNTPADFINMADAILCPNRGSFFDLSMIEALSVGTPIIAAKVGGYKFLEGMTSGVIYFDKESIDGLTQSIIKFYNITVDISKSMHRSNIELYNKYLTPKLFAQNYLNIIDEIYNDFNIQEPNRTIIRMPTIIEVPPPAGINRSTKSDNHEKQISSVNNKNCNLLTPNERKWLKLYRNPKLYFRDLIKNILAKFWKYR